MRASAIEKLKLETVCHEDTIKYKTSPQKKPKIELDQKIDDSVIDEEVSQDDIVDFLEDGSWTKFTFGFDPKFAF